MRVGQALSPALFFFSPSELDCYDHCVGLLLFVIYYGAFFAPLFLLPKLWRRHFAQPTTKLTRKLLVLVTIGYAYQAAAWWFGTPFIGSYNSFTRTLMMGTMSVGWLMLFVVAARHNRRIAPC